MQERIIELEERVNVLEKEKEGMGRGLGAIQERCEEAFREQVSIRFGRGRTLMPDPIGDGRGSP